MGDRPGGPEPGSISAVNGGDVAPEGVPTGAVASPGSVPDGPGAADRPGPSTTPRRSLRRWWPWLRHLVGLAIAGVALWAVLGHRGELSGFSHALLHLRWGWAAVALVAEVGSYLSFAVAQRRLLAVTGVDVALGPMAVIVLVATTITNSLPAGPVVSTVFTFRQFRRRGADDVGAGWVLAAALVCAGVALALLTAAGLAVAGAEGSGSDLYGVTAGVVVVSVAGAALLVQRRALIWATDRVLAAAARLPWLSTERSRRSLARLEQRLAAVRIAPGQMATAVTWMSGNWVLDCGCLCLAYLAVGAPVPWHGLLLAYGAGQLAANLPITPGGLGVVEGSMTVALVAFGGDLTTTATAVLLYRVISYWLELPVGWATWGGLLVGQRRRDRAVAARSSDALRAGLERRRGTLVGERTSSDPLDPAVEGEVR